ncbi:regulatory protein GemA [Rhodoplanes serenus]|nr:regulatory protein GemA [Rhodoplanes serenus]
MIGAPASARQIGAIHSIAKRIGLDEAERRGLIEQVTGKRSAGDLDAVQAGRVIDRLKALSGQGSSAPRSTFTSGLPAVLPPAPPAKGAMQIDGPYAGKLRALWITAHDLGIVRDRTDRALCAFVERQTKIAHPRWLRDAADAARAIEALKSWIAREGGITWPARDAEPSAIKRAVLEAQWRRLVDLGAVTPWTADRPLGDLPTYAARVTGKWGWDAYTAADYAAVQDALGRKLRRAQAQRERTR